MIFVDIFEPDIILHGLSQVFRVERISLNIGNRADYFWIVEHDGHSVQIERKQVGEVLGDFGAVEEALLRYLPNADETSLLIEGVVVPTQEGCDTYIQSEDKPYFRLSHRFGKKDRPLPGLYSKYQAWRWSLDKQGISIYDTHTVQGTTRAISSFYNNSQKIEHSTLNRYIRPKPITNTPNPHVRALMALSIAYGLNIGEDRANSLINMFGSLGAILKANVKTIAQVDGIGIATAKKILERIQ